LHSRAVGHIVWAVLLTQTKIIWIAGTAVRLFSLDGKLWFSRPHDLVAYNQFADYMPTAVNLRS
jgi:hypothetical protein